MPSLGGVNTPSDCPVCSTAAAMWSRPLTFGELAVDQHFIAFPLDGDDSGHGGFRRGSYLFRKRAGEQQPTCNNAERVSDGLLASMPATMRVILVLC